MLGGCSQIGIQQELIWKTKGWIFPLCYILGVMSKGNHLLGSCSLAIRIWNLLAAWLELPIPVDKSPSSLMEWLDSLKVRNQTNVVLGSVLFAVRWAI